MTCEANAGRILCAAGLDIERYLSETAEGVFAKIVNEALKKALFGDGVTGTPALYLNSVRLSAIQGVEALLERVTAARENLLAGSNE